MARIPCNDAQEMLKELRLNQRDVRDQVRLFGAIGEKQQADRLENMCRRQQELSENLRERLPIGMNFEKAKEIMKKDFYGEEETMIKLEWASGFKDMGPIPFSPQELREAKKQGQYLIHRFSKNSFDDDFDMRALRMAAPDRLESKRMLEGLFGEIEDFALSRDTVSSGWKLADLRPQSGFNFPELTLISLNRAGMVDQSSKERETVRKAIQTHNRNKSVSDIELKSITKRELGKFDKLRHSLNEFYYDAIVTDKLPEIAREILAMNYISSDSTGTGFKRIDFIVDENGNITTNVSDFSLTTWDVMNAVSFQRDS